MVGVCPAVGAMEVPLGLLDCAVPGPVAHGEDGRGLDAEGFAALRAPGDEGMPGAVLLAVAELGPLQERLPDVLQEARVAGELAVLPQEHPLPLLGRPAVHLSVEPHRLAVALQPAREVRIEWHPAVLL